METIQETVVEDDFESQVEFDLLQDDDDNQDNQDSVDVYPYSDFKVHLGSVKSVVSSTLDLSKLTSNQSEFNVIIDSGYTRHMCPDRDTFLTYKPCSHSFVILADKSKTACLGIGTVTIMLGVKILYFTTCFMFQTPEVHFYLSVVFDVSRAVVF